MPVISFDASKPSSILSTASAQASDAVDLPSVDFSDVDLPTVDLPLIDLRAVAVDADVDNDQRGESDLLTPSSSASSTEPGVPSAIAGETTRTDGPGATLAPAMFAQEASGTGGGSSGSAPDQGSIWAAAAGSGVTIVVARVANHIPVLVVFGLALWCVKHFGNKKKNRLEQKEEVRSGESIDLRPEEDGR